MLSKFRSFLEITKEFGLKTAIEGSFLYLRIPIHVHIKYPITSLEITIDKGPLTFWRHLEQGNWEINLIKFINELITPGEIILDVGAWMGPTTLLFSHLTGKTGRVYAFEPMLGSFSILESYINHNNLENVRLYNMACSNTLNYLTIYSPSQTSSIATTLKPNSLVSPTTKSTEYKLQQKCKCTTIDEFCSSLKIKPNGIKIDVEGAEGNVLEGAIKTLEKYHPWCLLEFHGPFLSESERQRTWSLVTNKARRILYIEGDEEDLTYKMELAPDFQPSKRANYCIFY